MKKLLLSLLIVMLVGSVMAVPTAPVISGITNNAFTATTTGDTAPTWFMWGQNAAAPEWRTVNTSTHSVSYSGSPLMPSTTYYVVAVDSTGASSAATSFSTLAATPIPQTTYGSSLTNITQNNFNLIMVIQQIPVPFLWEFPSSWNTNGMGIALCAGLLFGFYFLGLWFRQRKVTGPMILGLIMLAFILTPQTGLTWGLPPEIAMIAQMATYAALTGVLVSLLKK